MIGFLAYGFIGIGKFAATFLPWQLSPDPATNVNLYGLIITAITTLYAATRRSSKTASNLLK